MKNQIIIKVIQADREVPVCVQFKSDQSLSEGQLLLLGKHLMDSAVSKIDEMLAGKAN